MARMVAWTSGALPCPLPVTLAAVLARDASHLSVTPRPHPRDELGCLRESFHSSVTP